MSSEARKAVIMARGLGTRMRRDDARTQLSDAEASVATTGVKALIPLNSRPFLDYVISGLADAGFDQVCLVVAPEHEGLREQYVDKTPPRRVKLSFAIQAEPRGTADAVLAARGFAGEDFFVVLNSDNYYPVHVMRALRLLGRPGLPGFDRTALVRESNIDPDRIARYALLEVGPDGVLRHIVEKPDPDTVRAMGKDAPVSMNCWLFGPRIFEACAAIKPSARGEVEIAGAVEWATGHGETFTVFPVAEGVLDLTSRGDISAVARRLATVRVNL